MIDDDDIPAAGLLTEQEICGRPALVFWQPEAIRAFPGDAEQLKAIERLEAAMIRYPTVTVLYHIEQVDGHHVTFKTSENRGCIFVTVALGRPIVNRLPQELINEPD